MERIMIVTAIFEAKAGKVDELRKQLHNGASESWKEPGVKSYAVHELIDRPGVFMNIEVYADEAAFKSHLETPHVKAFLGMLDDLLANPLTVYQGSAQFVGEHAKATI
jgi:quinol monooxygenase YgiN